MGGGALRCSAHLSHERHASVGQRMMCPCCCHLYRRAESFGVQGTCATLSIELRDAGSTTQDTRSEHSSVRVCTHNQRDVMQRFHRTWVWRNGKQARCDFHRKLSGLFEDRALRPTPGLSGQPELACVLPCAPVQRTRDGWWASRRASASVVCRAVRSRSATLDISSDRLNSRVCPSVAMCHRPSHRISVSALGAKRYATL